MYITAVQKSIDASRRGRTLALESIDLTKSINRIKSVIGNANSEQHDLRLRGHVHKTCLLAKEGYDSSKGVWENFRGVRQTLMKESVISNQLV